MSSRGLRPTRRDLLVVLLTFGIAFVFFTAPQHPALSSGGGGGASGSGSGRKWNLFGGHRSDNCDPADGSVVGHAYPAIKKEGFVRANPDQKVFNDDFSHLMTKKAGHSDGWTMFEKLYLFNGQLWVVTESRSDWPELRLMTSTGLPAENVPGNKEAREPKGDEILFITPKEAYEKWGSEVYALDGMTWLFNDGQFINHYYHFAAELLLGVWRVHATLDPEIDAYGNTVVAPPARAWFLHQDQNEWRDAVSFNDFLWWALLPKTAILYPRDLKGSKVATAGAAKIQKAYVFEKAILADRSASFRGDLTGPTQRTVAAACGFGTASPWWWEPIRRQMGRYAGVDDKTLDRNLEGVGAIDPVEIERSVKAGNPRPVPLAPVGDYRPTVTYISRQNTRRRLTTESHEELVKALEARAKKLNFELVIVAAEKLNKDEQIAIAARTTIMLGVHGNGLTHLLWMPATPRSAVIEMFVKGGFAHDYSWTAHALGMRHFAVQHDQAHTSPNRPKVDYPEGFQGSGITVVGEFVADLIEDRLAGRV